MRVSVFGRYLAFLFALAFFAGNQALPISRLKIRSVSAGTVESSDIAENAGME